MRIEGTPILYHYCNIDSFMGILKNKTIFLSQVSTMNDLTEYKWLREIAKAKRKQRYDQLNDGHLFENERTSLERLYTEIAIRQFSDDPPDPYCACFSKKGDVLSQWRAYADQGRGFSIGFDARNIPEEWDRNTHGNFHSIGPVRYSKDWHEHIVELAFLDLENDLDEKKIDQRYFKDRAEKFMNEVLYHAIYCKNQAFEEEDEVRAVLERPSYDNCPATAPGVRSRGSQLIHYLTMPLERLFGPTPFAQIYIGPMNPLLSNRKPLDLMLADLGLTKDIEVFESAARLAP